MAFRERCFQYFCKVYNRNISTTFAAFHRISTQKLSITQTNSRFFSTGKRNYYDVLEITPNANAKDIKDAYFRLSKLYHPDVNKDNKQAVQKFQELTEAYEILGNSSSRREYDRNMDRYRNLEEDARDQTMYRPRRRSHVEYRGRTEHYDYDEWIRRHYEMEEEVRRRTYPQRNRRDRRHDHRIHEEEAVSKSIFLWSFFVSLFSFFFLLQTAQYYSEATYDTRLSRSSQINNDKKKD